MPVTRMLTPVDIEYVALSCDSCQAAVYAPTNPWTETREMRIRRKPEQAGARGVTCELLPNVTEQQAVELSMRQGWQVVTWCGRRRVLCPNCAGQEAREHSPIRAS